MRSFITWTGQVAHMGEKRNAFSSLVGKPEGRRSRGQPMHRQKDNVKLDVKEIEWECVNGNHLARVREKWQVIVTMVINLWVP
jgi:hypothetical protein